MISRFFLLFFIEIFSPCSVLIIMEPKYTECSSMHVLSFGFIIPPVYEVYRGYIVFAFSVRMFVCLSVCL